MPQQRLATTAGQKCLTWLLVLAIGLMGLTITRQQVLGSLHSHAEQTPRTSSVLNTALSNLASDWISRWQQQQVIGHGQWLLGTASDATTWPVDSAAVAEATRSHDADAHDHNSLERHHHAAHDASVVALDGAAQLADAADSSANGASVLLASVGALAAGLSLPTVAEHNGPWPAGRMVAFVSRSVPPLLRPPTV